MSNSIKKINDSKAKNMWEEISPGVWCATPPDNRDVFPNIVFVHGWVGNARRDFNNIVKKIRQNWTVYSVDLAGHQNGTKIDSEPTMDFLAEDIVEKLNKVNVNKATFVGYSLGGAVCQHIGKNFPTKVEGMVLAGTATKLKHTPVINLALILWHRTAKKLVTKNKRAEIISEKTLGRNYGLRRNLLNIAQKMRTFITVNRKFYSPHLLIGSIMKFDSTQWFPAMNFPIVALICTNDRIVPTRRQVSLAAHPNVLAAFTVPGGHNAFVTTPKLFSDALQKALSTIHYHE